MEQARLPIKKIKEILEAAGVDYAVRLCPSPTQVRIVGIEASRMPAVMQGAADLHSLAGLYRARRPGDAAEAASRRQGACICAHGVCLDMQEAALSCRLHILAPRRHCSVRRQNRVLRHRKAARGDMPRHPRPLHVLLLARAQRPLLVRLQRARHWQACTQAARESFVFESKKDEREMRKKLLLLASLCRNNSGAEAPAGLRYGRWRWRGEWRCDPAHMRIQ